MIKVKDGYYFRMFCPDSYFVPDHSGSIGIIGCVIYRKHWNFDVGAFQCVVCKRAFGYVIVSNPFAAYDVIPSVIKCQFHP